MEEPFCSLFQTFVGLFFFSVANSLHWLDDPSAYIGEQGASILQFSSVARRGDIMNQTVA